MCSVALHKVQKLFCYVWIWQERCCVWSYEVLCFSFLTCIQRKLWFWIIIIIIYALWNLLFILFALHSFIAFLYVQPDALITLINLATTITVNTDVLGISPLDGNSALDRQAVLCLFKVERINAWTSMPEKQVSPSLDYILSFYSCLQAPFCLCFVFIVNDNSTKGCHDLVERELKIL